MIALAAGAFALSIGYSFDAAATAQRTFVASTGNDAAPCSLAQPCRGFARAITQTNAGGEVIVLDSAGYGPVTITKSVSLIAPMVPTGRRIGWRGGPVSGFPPDFTCST